MDRPLMLPLPIHKARQLIPSQGPASHLLPISSHPIGRDEPARLVAGVNYSADAATGLDSRATPPGPARPGPARPGLPPSAHDADATRDK